MVPVCSRAKGACARRPLWVWRCVKYGASLFSTWKESERVIPSLRVAGNFENFNVGVILSTDCCSWMVPMALDWCATSWAGMPTIHQHPTIIPYQFPFSCQTTGHLNVINYSNMFISPKSYIFKDRPTFQGHTGHSQTLPQPERKPWMRSIPGPGPPRPPGPPRWPVTVGSNRWHPVTQQESCDGCGMMWIDSFVVPNKMLLHVAWCLYLFWISIVLIHVWNYRDRVVWLICHPHWLKLIETLKSTVCIWSCSVSFLRGTSWPFSLS